MANRHISERRLAELAFIFTVFIWGGTFVLTKKALDDIGPFAYNSIRTWVGAIILIVMTGKSWRSFNISYLWPSLVCGLVLFGSYALQTFGQQYTTASKAGFLTGTNVAYVPFLSALILHRKPEKAAIFGVALAICGLYLISFEGAFSLAKGDSLVALSGFGWALYIICLAYYSPRLNVVLLSCLHVIFSALFHTAVWVLREPIVLPTSIMIWTAILVCGIFIIGFGSNIQTWVCRVSSPTKVGLIAAIEPVFAAIGGVGFGGETLTPRIILGGTIILAGMLLSEASSFRLKSFFSSFGLKLR
jgi:drug/metabolite transporter (DMT)-like permease